MNEKKSELKGNAVPPVRPPATMPPPPVVSHVQMSDTQAALQFAEKRGTVDLIPLPNGMAVAAVPAGKEIVSMKHFIDEWMDRPPRHFGTSRHHTVKSLVKHANMFKLDGTVVFVETDGENVIATVIYNYRKPELAEFGDWRAIYIGSQLEIVCIDNVVELIEDETGLPVFIGSPE